jgi:glycosyltransferase involved in cell wall biosynthesis
MTHYPRTAQTFIAGEIDGVERAGISVQCFAMNRPAAAELAVPGAEQRHARTIYLKARPWLALIDAAILTLRHPIGMASVVGTAVHSAGGNPRRILRRIAHVVQAARIARTGGALGLRHLHAHFGLAPATIGWFASRLMSLGGTPVGFSFTIHGFHDFADPAETRLDLKAQAAAAVVCISDFTRGQLFLQADPALWAKAQVIRCGIDLEKWRFAPPQRSGGSPTIVAIGRLSPEKGFSILLEALASLRDDGVSARLRLVGDGPERTTIEATIARLDLAKLVTLTGELEPGSVRAELQDADIYCLPSFSEGLPVSIMEAMAVGVPVVTTWIAGIPELAADGVTALTVPPARPDTLAAALRRLIEQPGLAGELTDAARMRVEAQHDQARNGAALAELFGSLVS